MGDDIETRFNYHVKALGDIGLGLGLVGVTVETLQTSSGALETNLDDQFQSLQSIVDGNSNFITDLEISSSATGVTVEILQTSIDTLDTNLDGQLQSLNETVNINSIAITTLGDDIKTCFNYHRNVLGDIGLGLGLVGVTVQTLQTSLDALDTNIEGQLQTLNETVNGNSTDINTLTETSVDIETRVNYHRKALGDLGLGLGLVGVTVETLQTNLDALDTSIEGQLQTLNETVGGNSTAITTLSDDIDTRFTHHRNALDDLDLGLGLVGVTVETLQTNLNALAAISLPDLAGYALETYVEGAVAAISLPDLAGYALETVLTAQSQQSRCRT